MSFRVFLLSPANCRGRRAQQVMADHAAFPLAVRLRSPGGVPIGELFAHVSGLYFRGKLTYARRFANAPAEAGSGVLIITPDRGLMAADTVIGFDTFREFGQGDIRADNLAYCRPLEASALRLASVVGSTGEFVLLGSVASEKYVPVLGRIFGSRLTFPAAFVGRGDMSRGGLLLRAAASGRELDYLPVGGAVLRGPRPPKLEPRKSWDELAKLGEVEVRRG